MKATDIRNQVLRLLWVEDPTLAPPGVLDDVRNAVNAAFQELWSAPENWFKIQADSVAFSGGSTSAALDDNVQQIAGAVENAGTGRYLLACRTRGELMHYGNYQGAATADDPSGSEPLAYWLERFQSGEDVDSVGVNLHIAPAAPGVGTTNLTLQVIKDPPSYTLAELADTDQEIPFPQGYDESILIPFVRFWAMKSHYFLDFEKAGMIEAEYMAARARLGWKDHRQKVRRDNPNQEAERAA